MTDREYVTIKCLITAVELLLDQVDYTNGACSVTEMVGGCLDERIIEIARTAIKQGYEVIK